MTTTVVHTRKLALIGLLLGSLLVAGALGLAAPSHADPRVLFAAPSGAGSGDCNSWSNACTLQAALSQAPSLLSVSAIRPAT